MCSMRKIGGHRWIGTRYIACQECGVHFTYNTPHPEFEYIVMVSGFPVYERCSHIGEVVPAFYEFSDDRKKYNWVMQVSKWC